MHLYRRPDSARTCLVLGFALLVAAALHAQQAREDYPRINTATGYRVDPGWPQKPAGFTWEAMPGVAVDARERVWIFTRSTPPVQAYDTKGRFLRAWGEKEIHTAHHLKIDAQGNIWVADVGHHQVMQFTPEGKLLRSIGTRGEPGEDETRLNQPTDMAVTASGEVFVTDGYGNNRVVHFDRNGKFVRQWGKLGTEPGEFSLPHAIVLDSKGRLYVADRNNARVQVFDQKGSLLDQWKNVIVPWGFWVTSSDEIWVCGSSPMQWHEGPGVMGVPPKDQLFMKFDTTGRMRALWTVPKGEDGREQPGELNWVHALALDAAGNIYAGDINGKRAQKFVKIQ